MSLVIDGAMARLKREHNHLAWHAWHVARLTAYAPQKPRDFVPLRRLMAGEARTAKSGAGNWKQEYAAFAAWAESFKRH